MNALIPAGLSQNGAALQSREGVVSRSGRLLQLIEALRRHRRPVSGAALAAETGISLRSLYRDIATLRAQGAPIDGSAGLGFVLGQGWLLPSLAFDADERDALVLGLCLAARRGDPPLRRAAASALAKIEAVLPGPSADLRAGAALGAGPSERAAGPTLTAIRAALRAERKLRLGYRDKAGRATERIVWPVAVGFFDAAEVLAAWCELRCDFRHFRLDRIGNAVTMNERMPRRHPVLLAEWRLLTGIDSDEG